MELVGISERLTHKYRDGWSYEDRWSYLTSLKLTPPKVTDPGNGYDDGPTYVRYARLPAGVDAKRIIRAIHDSLGGSNCRHEHDCCGCASYRVDAKLVAPRKLLIHTSVGYNY